MIRGEVTANREAVIYVVVLDGEGLEQRVRAVLDTGFSGFLTLPQALITQLGLEFVTNVRGLLADGSFQRLRVYACDVLWDGNQRRVQVHAAEGGILAGMSLLHGSQLTIDVIDGGDVTITPLP